MLSWAAGLPAAELVIDKMSPVTLTAIRTAIAAAFLVPLWWALEGTAAVSGAPWRRGILIGGVCIGLAAILLVMAQARTDPVTVAVVTATMPVIGIAMEWLLDGRRLTAGLVAGLVLSLVGGALAFGAISGSPELGAGALAALASVLAFTWGSRETVASLPRMTPLGRTAVTVAGSAIVSVPLVPIVALLGGPATDWPAIGPVEWGALAVFGLGSLAISQVLWIAAIGSLGIGISSLHMNAAPFYVMLITFALGSPWNWMQAASAAIVAVGVLLAQGIHPWRRTANP
jgi:drug/metabolite transporter (DMT)-like permease